jgi:hypothetical protein
MGSKGHRNEVCANSSTVIIANSTSDGRLCNTNTDCPLFYYCSEDGNTNRCKPILKSCHNNCSDHGTCEIIDSATQWPLSSSQTCNIDDDSCDVNCICHDGYKGQYCSLSTQEFTLKQSLRHLIVTNTHTSASTALDAVGISSILQSLESSNTNIHEINSNASGIVYDIMDILVNNIDSQSISLDYDTIHSLMHVGDLTLQAQVQNRKTTLRSYNDTRHSNIQQRIYMSATSLMDDSNRYNGEHMVGDMVISYNNTFAQPVSVAASASEVAHVINSMSNINASMLATVVKSKTAIPIDGVISLDTLIVTESDTSITAVIAKCVSYTCSFDNLPAGDLVLLNNQWLTVHVRNTFSSSRSSILILGAEDDYTSYIESGSLAMVYNATLYRWARAYRYVYCFFYSIVLFVTMTTL